MIARREFITLLAIAAAWPLAARAQQPKRMIGYLDGGFESNKRSPSFRGFQQGLAEAGYAEGRNVAIEYRWAEDRLERIPDLFADLVRRQVAVIVSEAGQAGATAAKAATTTIPVVFQGGFDPVEIGLVASLSRPGGNLTGVTSLNLELGPKRLEVMHELIPAAKVLALLINPDAPTAVSQSREMQTAAGALGLQLRIAHARAVNEFNAAFASLPQLGAEGLVIGVGGSFPDHGGELGALAARQAMPAIGYTRDFIAAGGLASYAGTDEEAPRLVGLYVGRILNGEKPADLPVQQVTKVELLLNLKTARALGIMVPITLLGRANEVIE
jgi:putative ABC transport system substrate-binding protein